ncbi:MAG: hypothetical protein NVS2B15_03060 [Pseudarthrobacter sp.]
MPGLVTGPRDGRYRDPVHPAANPGRVGFQIHLDGAGIQGTPAPAALALVISGATAPTDPTTVTHRTRGPDGRDQDPGFLVKIDGLHDRFLDTKQRSP